MEIKPNSWVDFDRERFEYLVNWLDRDTWGAAHGIVWHPACYAIKAAGYKAIPFIMEEIGKINCDCGGVGAQSRGLWSLMLLLGKMVDDSPTLPTHLYGDVKGICNFWITWYRNQCHLNENNIVVYKHFDGNEIIAHRVPWERDYSSNMP